MSRRVAAADRSGGEHETYPTPAWAVHRLLESRLLISPRGRWLEPCAGDGAIIHAANDHYAKLAMPGYEVPKPTWAACEIREACAPKLEALAHQDELYVGDFRQLAPKLHQRAVETFKDWFADVVITNPPYTMAVSFIEQSRKLAPLVVMLLRLNFLESEERAAWFEAGNMPRDIFVLPNRPSFTLGKTDSCAYGWMVWDNHIHVTSTVHRLALTPRQERGAKR